MQKGGNTRLSTQMVGNRSNISQVELQSISNSYLMPRNLMFNCHERPSTKTKVISQKQICLLTECNNNKPNNNTTTNCVY